MLLYCCSTHLALKEFLKSSGMLRATSFCFRIGVLILLLINVIQFYQTLKGCIRFKWIPYIPLQNGKDVFFKKKTLDLLCDTEAENCVEKFNNKHILDVVPEYSYKISASYLTKVP